MHLTPVKVTLILKIQASRTVNETTHLLKVSILIQIYSNINDALMFHFTRYPTEPHELTIITVVILVSQQGRK